MSTVETHVASPTSAITLPPGPRIPKALQGLTFALFRRQFVHQMAHRYGDVFSCHVPIYGPIVVVANPQLAKQVFTTSPDMLGNIQPNLSRLLGSGSVFALDRDDHRQRRRLLAPPFHGKSIKNYETIIEEETLREIASWPEGHSVRHAAVDDAHHAQRDPARGVRCRGRRTRRAAPHHPAVGHAGFAAGDVAQTASYLSAVTRRGAGCAEWRAPLRRDRRQAHRRRTQRPVFRGPDRRAGADAAQHLRGRFVDVARRHRRRAADPAGGRTRDHRVRAGLDVRTGEPAPRGADRSGCRGRHRRQRVAAGDRSSRRSAAEP